MEYMYLVAAVLLVMAVLMRVRKLDFLLFRYQTFQNTFRKGTFNLDEEGLSRAYTYIFIFSAVIVVIYALTREMLGFWGEVVLFIAVFAQLFYLNVTKKFLVFEE
jgi:hypothetical protein